jgi:hypothetical protein
LVPRTVAGEVEFPSPTIIAGSWIKPPPPEMASTKPAKPEAKSRKMMISKERSIKKRSLRRGAI